MTEPPSCVLNWMIYSDNKNLRSLVTHNSNQIHVEVLHNGKAARGFLSRAYQIYMTAINQKNTQGPTSTQASLSLLAKGTREHQLEGQTNLTDFRPLGG
jgi:hypothetical protein